MILCVNEIDSEDFFFSSTLSLVSVLHIIFISSTYFPSLLQCNILKYFGEGVKSHKKKKCLHCYSLAFPFLAFLVSSLLASVFPGAPCCLSFSSRYKKFFNRESLEMREHQVKSPSAALVCLSLFSFPPFSFVSEVTVACIRVSYVTCGLRFN